MDAKLVKQPWDTDFGGEIQRLLDNPTTSRFWVASAWITRPGLQSLAPALRRFSRRVEPGESRGLFGIDFDGTTREGLGLATSSFGQVRVFHDRGGRVFHPKVFLLEQASTACVLIGSANMTAGGFGSNIELGLRIELDMTVAKEMTVLEDLRGWYQQLWSDPDGSRAADEEVIAALPSEEALFLSQARRPKGNIGPTLFPSPIAVSSSESVSRYDWLATLLTSATGLDHVRERREDPVGAEIKLEPLAESTQRLALGFRDGALTLCSWPGEKVGQARALYGTERGGRLLGLVESDRSGWSARPTPHLAFPHAVRWQRFYMRCSLDLADYIHRWSEDESLERAGSKHPHDTVRSGTWPWLLEHGFADREPDQTDQLDRFLGYLKGWTAQMRPGIEVERRWSWQEARDLDERQELVGEIRSAINELLAALAEPQLPDVTTATGS